MDVNIAVIDSSGLRRHCVQGASSVDRVIESVVRGPFSNVFTVSSPRDDGGTLVGYEFAQEEFDDFDERDDADDTGFSSRRSTPPRAIVVHLASSVLGGHAPFAVVAYDIDGRPRDLVDGELDALQVSESDTAVVLRVA